MDWTKYNQVPTDWATASAIGLAAATLGAMERRGFVESIATKPKQYRRIVTPAVTIYRLLEENKDDYGEFFTLQKREGKFNGRMLCYVKGGDVVDCWGNKYDLSDVIYIEFRTRGFFMNNKTVERIEIKRRGDNVYDIYVNKVHIGEAGCYLSALNKVKEYMEGELE